MTTVRIRGIYTTALTRLCEQADIEIVQASDPIHDRFHTTFENRPADVSIETSRDRRGICLMGPESPVAAVRSILEDLAIDTFCWSDHTPLGAVFDGTVTAADGGGGAEIDLGEGKTGYLAYDEVDDYVDAGNRYRVQVIEPTPPWSTDHARVKPGLEISSGLVSLSRNRTGIAADVSGEQGDELVGLTDLLSVEIPDGWGLRWHEPALDVDVKTMTDAVERVVDRVQELEHQLDGHGEPSTESGEPSTLATPQSTVWLWFGRESRFALDDARRSVAPTMAGHHRIKASHRRASAAVDFAEAICDPPGGTAGGETTLAGTNPDAANESQQSKHNQTRSHSSSTSDDSSVASSFPFAAVSRHFGPAEGDRIQLGHGKPDGRYISLGNGTITSLSTDGTLTLERSMRGGGTYDALDVPIEEGDVATTKLREGRWWYPTTYRDADGDVKGTYVNVCTPVELFPDCARYVDLYVDVIRQADGSVSIVDSDELDEAASNGLVTDQLAERARRVATAVERALSK